MDKSFYHNQLLELLGDQVIKKIQSDPTGPYKRPIIFTCEWGFRNNALNLKESRYLNPSACRIPVIHTLPKIHKNIDKPPARPIVNGIGLISARLGEYLDKFLQPSVKKLKPTLRDTTDILRLLNEVRLNPATMIYLVTADVWSLYTIIQHDDALLALNWALSKRDDILHMQKCFLGKVLCPIHKVGH